MEGIAKAKAAGVYKGRKPSVPVEEVRRLRGEGKGDRPRLPKPWGIPHERVAGDEWVSGSTSSAPRSWPLRARARGRAATTEQNTAPRRAPATCRKIPGASCGIWDYCRAQSRPGHRPGEEGEMIKAVLLLLMAYAAVGLVLSLVVHLLSFVGLQPGGVRLSDILNTAIFPLWAAVMLISYKISRGTHGKDFWKVVWSGCPPWMKYMTYGFFTYSIANIVLTFVLTTIIVPVNKELGGSPPHLMLFYAAGLAILTSAYRRGLSNLERRCPNGHVVADHDRFCPTCGMPLDVTPPREGDRQGVAASE